VVAMVTVALPDAALEVHRDPSGDDYRDVAILRAGDAITPVASPAAISVVDLLP